MAPLLPVVEHSQLVLCIHESPASKVDVADGDLLLLRQVSVLVLNPPVNISKEIVRSSIQSMMEAIKKRQTQIQHVSDVDLRGMGT